MKLNPLALQQVQPKVRMIGNGSTRVNVIRAEHAGAVAVTTKALAERAPTVRGDLAQPVRRRQIRALRGKQKALTGQIDASVFIHLTDTDASLGSFGTGARRGRLATAKVRIADLPKLARVPSVSFVEMGEPVSTPDPIVHAGKPKAPSHVTWWTETLPLHNGGADILIGIIDVQGFDFAHPDFLDSNGRTRFERIWDQGGSARPAPKTPKSRRYGAEFLKKHLDAAIARAPKERIPATDLEAQSQRAPGSHGTHVASIAAGNAGLCPNARLAAVLLDLPTSDLDRRRSFCDSTRIAHAFDYLISLADDLKLPVSINISLGTNGHAHDGTSAINRWIDSALTEPGRAVCVAAGNAGQEKATTGDDIGWVMGRIHTSGQIAARGLDADLEWIVVGNGVADISENELEIWYSAQDRFGVSVQAPDGTWIGPVATQEFVENRELADGTFVSIYNELYHPANGSNYISIYLSPFFSEQGVAGVGAGVWKVRLHGEEVRDGRFRGWIERDDPRRIGRIGSIDAWRFPSFFSERSNVDDSSISSLACGHNVIAVANLDDPGERIHITSSQGPTRDSRWKPEIAAPGTQIVAAKGFAGNDDLWIAMTGTSMASPYACGVAGLMLAAQPRLTSSQINGMMVRTARPLPGGTFAWKNDAGFGRLDPAACLREARSAFVRKDVRS